MKTQLLCPPYRPSVDSATWKPTFRPDWRFLSFLSPQKKGLHLFCMVISVIMGSGGVLSYPAYADRPWQDAPQQAHLISDHILNGAVMPIITALPDGTVYSLSPAGVPQRIDPETGTLYPLTGLPAFSILNATNQGLWGISKEEEPALINIAPNGSIRNHVALGNTVRPGSHFSALQVSKDIAFIADEGVPALIIIDLATGKTQRVIEANPSLIAHRPIERGGIALSAPDGRTRSGGNIRFLVVNHTGDWLFYQAPPGPLYRIGTDLLTDPAMSPAQQIEGMAKWRDTPSLGGLGIWSDDSLYMVDIAHGDILKFGEDRLPWRLFHDPALFWAQDMALLPRNAQAPLSMIILVEKDGKNHLLTYGLP